MTGLKLTSEHPTRLGLWGPAIAAALVAGLLIGAVGIDRVSRPLFDLWQRSAPRTYDQSEVRIVWIDDASIKVVGPWPWPRYVVARLTETLARGRPRVIGYDMLFADPDRNTPDAFASLYPELAADTLAKIRALPSMDSVLAEVIGKSPVVLGRAGLDAKPLGTPPTLAVELQFGTALPPSTARWGLALSNIPVLDDVALGHGLLNGEPDTDGVIRRVPLVGRVAGIDMPGFALELARVARGVDRIDPVVSRGTLNAILFDHHRLPVEPSGQARLRFGVWPVAATLSAIDLIDGSVSPDVLAGKIVLVGFSAAGSADVVTTPLSDKGYGTAVQAEAVDAILTGALLSRPAWAWLIEAGLATMMIGTALVIGPRLRGFQAGMMTLGAVLITLGLSAVAFYRFGLLIDATGPLIIAAAAAATLVFLLFAHARRTLQEERLVSARAAGELSAARQIQLGMLPKRSGLARFDASVDLDALIEPARSVGGDFYDAIRLDEHRVCFLIGDVTGKGIPAALFMALSKALTKSVLLREGHDLGAAVTRLNDEIARDNSEDMFVTMLFGLLDTRSGRLDLCNAGHENPYRIDPAGAVTLIKLDGGPPLAVVAGFAYETETLTLSPGESIVIVSDGITEAQSPDGDFFGHERLSAVLTNWQANSDVAGASNALLADVRAFEDGAEATDDLTVLVFRYAGSRLT